MGSISPHALARALAAAEKRMALLPSERWVCGLNNGQHILTRSGTDAGRS